MSLLLVSQKSKKLENVATRWGLKPGMPRDLRKHGNCLEKAMQQGSTFTIRPQKNKEVHPGGKVSLARSGRWRENNNPDLFAFSSAKQATKLDSFLLIYCHFNFSK